MFHSHRALDRPHPIESVHASHENRSLGVEQLDDGIADTLVGETQFAPLPWADRPLQEQNLAHRCCETQRDPHLVDSHWVVVVEFPSLWGVIRLLCSEA